MKNNNENNDILQVQGRMAYGYGIIPKMAMQDKRLTIEAKAIYAYICSFAGAGTTAFPSRNKIILDLKISEDRYYRHFNLLKKHGYLTVEQHTDSGGKFKRNIYTLIENIKSEQNETAEPYPCFEGTEPNPYFTDTGNPDTGNKGTKNNSIKINNKKNNNTMDIKLSTSTSDVNSKNNEKNLKNDNDNDKDFNNIDKSNNQSQKLDSPIYEYNTIKALIHKNIDYAHYVKYKDNPLSTDIRLIDELVNCMLDVICTAGQEIKINSELKDRKIVIEKYLSINSADIEHIILKYKEQNGKIKHIHSYLKTLLYTVKQENNFFYENDVRASGII